MIWCGCRVLGWLMLTIVKRYRNARGFWWLVIVCLHRRMGSIFGNHRVTHKRMMADNYRFTGSVGANLVRFANIKNTILVLGHFTLPLWLAANVGQTLQSMKIHDN